MPAPGSSAKRYAQAVFEIARERDTLDRWLEDLRAVAQLAADPQAAALLQSPRLPLETKRRLLREALVGAGQEAVNLAMLLDFAFHRQLSAADAARRAAETGRGSVRVLGGGGP